MNDRSKQIIPDSQAVARCLDPEMLEILGSHGTFILSELLDMFKGSNVDCIDFNDRVKFIEKLTDTVAQTIQQGHSRQYLMNKVSTLVKGSMLDPSKDSPRLNNTLLSGINCNLLQPDGKGWQKGKLKICFEFIPEEPEDLHSPLDEIRQLSN
ncbi:KGK domain-containing protein [Chamaesiphon sp. GL140_3_metabinner_50]|uniref:KGK domain-containing protein n=1 Tax=Chamaesiphon sp. GL140_3_metabinner_50 TaxID=2970812 RepID=UPI0025CEB64A|nr:KGK domain-containing protein [Chamaesiphon sp. GL140_3_metabinner_50]